jgi:hypothetical protein
MCFLVRKDIRRKNKMHKFTVTYSVKFHIEIKIPNLEALQEAVENIDIPEDGNSSYVGNSFEIVEVQDKNGRTIPKEHL